MAVLGSGERTGPSTIRAPARDRSVDSERVRLDQQHLRRAQDRSLVDSRRAAVVVERPRGLRDARARGQQRLKPADDGGREPKLAGLRTWCLIDVEGDRDAAVVVLGRRWIVWRRRILARLFAAPAACRGDVDRRELAAAGRCRGDVDRANAEASAHLDLTRHGDEQQRDHRDPQGGPRRAFLGRGRHRRARKGRSRRAVCQARLAAAPAPEVNFGRTGRPSEGSAGASRRPCHQAVTGSVACPRAAGRT